MTKAVTIAENRPAYKKVRSIIPSGTISGSFTKTRSVLISSSRSSIIPISCRRKYDSMFDHAEGVSAEASNSASFRSSNKVCTFMIGQIKQDGEEAKLTYSESFDLCHGSGSWRLGLCPYFRARGE